MWATLFGRDRDASGLSNCLVVFLLFVHDATPFRNFPPWLQFVEFGRIYPGLRVRLWVVYRDFQFQGVMVQPPVTLRKVRLVASRIAKDVGPDFVVKPDRVDDECVSLPLADRMDPATGSGILGKRSPIRADSAPNV